MTKKARGHLTPQALRLTNNLVYSINRKMLNDWSQCKTAKILIENHKTKKYVTICKVRKY